MKKKYFILLLMPFLFAFNSPDNKQITSIENYAHNTQYFGRNNYVEYISGELPIVISAPHGGDLLPEEINTRSYGVVKADKNTAQLAFALKDALKKLTGKAPHVIISHLHRSKLDPNRALEEAAQGNEFAEQAWREFHQFIDFANQKVSTEQKGMYFDLHGHSHKIQRVEVGYLVTIDLLNKGDKGINSKRAINLSSLSDILKHSELSHAELIYGEKSFGSMLFAQGAAAIPSTTYPAPLKDKYFIGGYNTRQHRIHAENYVNAIQLEHPFKGFRDTDENRQHYADKLAATILQYMKEHLGYSPNAL